MPFKKGDTATARTVQMSIYLSPDEKAMITNAATERGISRVELIVQAVRAFEK